MAGVEDGWLVSSPGFSPAIAIWQALIPSRVGSWSLSIFVLPDLKHVCSATDSRKIRLRNRIGGRFYNAYLGIVLRDLFPGFGH